VPKTDIENSENQKIISLSNFAKSTSETSRTIIGISRAKVSIDKSFPIAAVESTSPVNSKPHQYLTFLQEAFVVFP